MAESLERKLKHFGGDDRIFGTMVLHQCARFKDLPCAVRALSGFAEHSACGSNALSAAEEVHVLDPNKCTGFF